MEKGRRGFFHRLLGLGGAAAAAQGAASAQASSALNTGGLEKVLPAYSRALSYESLKQSTYDRTGGNHDSRPIEPGATLEVFQSDSPGVITHIWFTIAAQSQTHLKDLIIRMYWDGNAKPSVEAPVGDFFGLNLGQYFIYESAYLACSPGKSLNCYFAMPFKRSARITIANEGPGRVNAFYSNIDYIAGAVPDDAQYFHAQYRQATPEIATTGDEAKLNPTGTKNHVYCESRGRGHLMGVTLGVQLLADGWMGEGDDMIFVDEETKPVIVGTGSEDYFLGSWNFGGRDGAIPFAHHYYGAPLIVMPERAGGRYCCYRWHGDNPIPFTKYLRYTMEHGHANDRADNWYSCAYWYQDRPYTDFPALPTQAERLVKTRFNAG